MDEPIDFTSRRRDARRRPVPPRREPPLDRGQPAAEVPADLVGEGTEPGEQGIDPRQRVGIVVDHEVDVVDLARETPVAVDQLAVEQLEHCPHPPARRLATGPVHDPAFVAIISGMVAAATTVSNTM